MPTHSKIARLVRSLERGAINRSEFVTGAYDCAYYCEAEEDELAALMDHNDTFVCEVATQALKWLYGQRTQVKDVGEIRKTIIAQPSQWTSSSAVAPSAGVAVELHATYVVEANE